MLGWRVYYGSMVAYDETMGPPELAPAVNVQAIAVADPVVGRYIWSQRDWYWWDHGQWFGGDFAGLLDYLDQPGWRKVVRGRSLPRAEFERVMAWVLEDPELPAKSGWAEGEARP